MYQDTNPKKYAYNLLRSDYTVKNREQAVESYKHEQMCGRHWTGCSRVYCNAQKCAKMNSVLVQMGSELTKAFSEAALEHVDVKKSPEYLDLKRKYDESYTAYLDMLVQFERGWLKDKKKALGGALYREEELRADNENLRAELKKANDKLAIGGESAG